MKNMGMGRAAFGFCFAWALAIGSSAFTLQGCSNDPAEQSQTKGTIELALSGTSSSGVLYRLRDAQINISGAALAGVASEDDPDRTEVSLELPAGGYLADLLDGWRLERSFDGGATFADVRALLISTDPLPFTVVDQGTTEVRLRFRAGDDVVELGNGRVIIGIDVIDSETPPPSGDCVEACAVAEMFGCPEHGLCVDICSNLPSLVEGTSCMDVAQEYVDCAQGEPGETYVCTPEGYPVAAACEFLFQDLIACLSAPPVCDVDNDGDGSCEGVDCDDFDPSVRPGAPDICNDGIDQNCDGVDSTVCAPAQWTCDSNFYGTDDGCDCGCGIADPDCTDPTVGACQYCGDPGSCSEGLECPGNIDPNDNATCLGGGCVDNDLDGACDTVDCDDTNPAVYPGASDPCGDGIDQDCDGADDSCAPANWTCPAAYYGTSDGCDCGCGVVDPDCANATVGVCEFCNDVGSCTNGATCPGNINPNNNATCF
ncbi:MAG TPA: putative metal-binding motif-containing protein [Polyangiaceae bacterium]|nr:putative metal-binding motif-containing protein [Polyangiaceae bacterium]